MCEDEASPQNMFIQNSPLVRDGSHNPHYPMALRSHAATLGRLRLGWRLLSSGRGIARSGPAGGGGGGAICYRGGRRTHPLKLFLQESKGWGG